MKHLFMRRVEPTGYGPQARGPGEIQKAVHRLLGLSHVFDPGKAVPIHVTRIIAGSNIRVAPDGTGAVTITALVDGEGVTDHDQLDGLTNDDHPQYLRVTRGGSGATYQGTFTVEQPGVPAGDGNPPYTLVITNPEVTRTPGWIKSFSTSDGNAETALHGGNDLFLSARDSVWCTDVTTGQDIPIRASQFIVSSKRSLKANIRMLTASDCEKWLERVTSLEPSTYFFRSESMTEVRKRADVRLGLIADDLPVEPVDANHEGVDLYALTTALVASVKQLNTKIDEQEEVIQALKSEIVEERK